MEANPHTYQMLTANSKVLENSHVQAIFVGESDKVGTLRSNVARGQPGWASFEDGGRNNAESIEVAVRTPDESIDDLGPNQQLCVVKVYVEGHDSKILRGASLLLKRDKSLVLCKNLSHN